MKSCGCGPKCQCDDKPKNYMFFGNLQIIQRSIEALMQMDPDMVDHTLDEHSWAIDHIATSADDILEVTNFFLNQSGHSEKYDEHGMMDNSMMGMDMERMVKSFESFVFEKKNHKLKSKKKKDQDTDGDMDFADAKIAQYMAGGMSRQEAVKLSRKFNKK
jgi:hypothetical protein